MFFLRCLIPETAREDRVEKCNRMARLARLERAARCLEGSCSIHLSYRRVLQV